MQNMDFWFFWEIFRRRWNIILFVACAGAVVAGVYSKLFITPVYQSSVSLYLGRVTEDSTLERMSQLTGKSGLSSVGSELALGTALTGDYQELLSVGRVRERVDDEIAKTGRWHKKAFGVTATPVNASRIMDISIASDDPVFCQEVATIYAREFIDEIQKIVGVQNMQIIEEPALNMSPISPNINRNIMIGGAIGFFITYLLFILARMLDRTIRTSEEVEQALNVPVVGTVHKDNDFQLDAKNPLLFGNNAEMNRAQVAEDFRVFRVNLMNQKPKGQKGGSVIAVTSSQAKEGKTFCTANLGAALAEAGYKVLLVDCDTGKRSLQRHLGNPHEDGLMNILSNETDFEHAVKKNLNNVQNMDVLFSGNPAVNSANLMISPKFKELMEKIKQEYDYAFLDVSCHLGTADIVSAGSSADSVLLLVRAGKTEGAVAKQTIDALKRANLDISGVILNGVEDK